MALFWSHQRKSLLNTHYFDHIKGNLKWSEGIWIGCWVAMQGGQTVGTFCVIRGAVVILYSSGTLSWYCFHSFPLTNSLSGTKQADLAICTGPWHERNFTLQLGMKFNFQFPCQIYCSVTCLEGCMMGSPLVRRLPMVVRWTMNLENPRQKFEHYNLLG